MERYVKAPALQRLKGVDMNCGLQFTSFPLFRNIQPYTRYEHSVNCARLAWHFTKDRKQALACLFHDIATPVFSHTVDFMHGDAMKQESTEDGTREIIENDPVISKLLEEDHIPIEDVCDYHRYPICDNDSPKLSCDRLEYILGGIVSFGFGTKEDVFEIVKDIVIGINEDSQPELCFQSEEKAVKFARYALHCGIIYSCCVDRYGMEVLSKLLKEAFELGILNEDDLYSDETAVVKKLVCSSLSEKWYDYTHMSRIRLSSAAKEGYLQVHAKKRYINPLVIHRGRVKDLNTELKKDIDLFLSDEQKLWIKGE